MIIDCFTFFNELPLLSVRLEELDPFVDKFVLVEANKTQTLLDKPYYFEENKHLFEKFLPKIVHVKVGDCPTDAPGTWKMEHFQRNAIDRGVKSLNPGPEDIIIISDVDEIPDFNRFPAVISGPLSARSTYHVFYANLVTENKEWNGTVVCPYEIYIQQSPQDWRDVKDSIGSREFCGWHLGNMGGKERVYEKFHSCIEPMDKSKILPFEEFSREFDRKIKSGGSFLFSDRQDDSIKCVECDISYPNLPESLTAERYPNLIWKN